MPSDLIKAVRKLDNLERAWRVIQQNGHSSKSEQVRLELEHFAENAPSNLRSIKGRLARGSFKFGKAKGIPIPKLNGKGRPTGKFRPIVLAPVESRIVQRAILNVLVEIEALRPYVQTPYSFGGIRSSRQRGTQSRSDQISAVPAAIHAALSEIERGACFVASADIRAFFTRISKDHVIGIIGSAVNDSEFVAFVRQAINVELENLSLLREKAADFPIEEIGVAQGNSLSPLLGNIALAEFDALMNEGDCRCIRYIDDFIIMAPTQRAANARLRRARSLLGKLSMELSPEKSAKGGAPVSDGFDFLGITICPGLVRPSKQAREKFIASIKKVFDDSQREMIGLKNGQTFKREYSLIATMKRADGIINGRGKHYWFCSDGQALCTLDVQIGERVRAFLGSYSTVRGELDPSKRFSLLGLSELSQIEREPFAYPNSKNLSD